MSLASPPPLKNPILWTKPPDIPEPEREMPESISWVIISVQSDTLSSRIISSQALWRPAVMRETSWHAINCEWLAEDKHKCVFCILDIKQRMCTEHIHGMESLTEYRLASGFWLSSPQGSIEVLNWKRPGWIFHLPTKGERIWLNLSLKVPKIQLSLWVHRGMCSLTKDKTTPLSKETGQLGSADWINTALDWPVAVYRLKGKRKAPS